MQASASSYTDIATAQWAVDHVIVASKNQQKIRRWLDEGAKRFLPLEGYVPGDAVGVVLSQADVAVPGTGHVTNYAKVLLMADAMIPTGYRILTSYPIVDVDPFDVDDTYPNLFDLVGGYYHQDWYELYDGSPQTALDDFVSSSTARQLASAIAELEQLCATTRGEAYYGSILRRLDNNYRFHEHGGLTAEIWLRTILTRLRIGACQGPFSDTSIT